MNKSIIKKCLLIFLSSNILFGNYHFLSASYMYDIYENISEEKSEADENESENEIETLQKNEQESYEGLQKEIVEVKVYSSSDFRYYVSDEAELRNAVISAQNSRIPTEIILLNSISFNSGIFIQNNTNVTFLGNYNIYMLGSGRHFSTVPAANTVVNFGSPEFNYAPFLVSNPNNGAGGININAATFNMYGGGISGVTLAGSGGAIGVISGGTFNMYGGEISDNSVGQHGGAINLAGGTTFNMHGGIIRGNRASADGGAVNLAQGFIGATFNMYGGIIENNSSRIGGGINIATNGIFNMYGGKILNNFSYDNRGFAINMFLGTYFQMNGGVIFGAISENSELFGELISSFGDVTINNDSVLIAWNKPTDLNSYYHMTAEDLVFEPEGAFVFWYFDNLSSESGIKFRYPLENPSNYGFIKLDVNIIFEDGYEDLESEDETEIVVVRPPHQENEYEQEEETEDFSSVLKSTTNEKNLQKNAKKDLSYSELLQSEKDSDEYFYVEGNVGGYENYEINYIIYNFDDVSSDDWFYSYVYTVLEKGLFIGTSSSSFSPNIFMNRAMFVQVLFNMNEIDLDLNLDYTTDIFSDVYNGSWYYEAVMWAKNLGITKGTGGNDFSPYDAITREQVVVFLHRFKNYFFQRETIKDSQEMLDSELISHHLVFLDEDYISPWALDIVLESAELGIIFGRDSGNFYSQDYITRAEASAIFVRFISLLSFI